MIQFDHLTNEELIRFKDTRLENVEVRSMARVLIQRLSMATDTMEEVQNTIEDYLIELDESYHAFTHVKETRTTFDNLLSKIKTANKP